MDPALASSLKRVQQYAAAQTEIKADLTLVSCTNNTLETAGTDNVVVKTPKARESALESIMINDATLQDLSLDFTLPGYGIDLVVSCDWM